MHLAICVRYVDPVAVVFGHWQSVMTIWRTENKWNAFSGGNLTAV